MTQKPERLSEDQVRKVAALCKVGLSDDEVERLRDEMATLLSEVNVLQSIDTTDVQPTGHAVEGVDTVMREDTPSASLSVDEVLSNAPRREGDYFRVQAVME